MGRLPVGQITFYMMCGFMIGFSVAMILVGDSPWQEFWIEMARCCDRG